MRRMPARMSAETSWCIEAKKCLVPGFSAYKLKIAVEAHVLSWFKLANACACCGMVCLIHGNAFLFLDLAGLRILRSPAARCSQDTKGP